MRFGAGSSDVTYSINNEPVGPFIKHMDFGILFLSSLSLMDSSYFDYLFQRLPIFIPSSAYCFQHLPQMRAFPLAFTKPVVPLCPNWMPRIKKDSSKIENFNIAPPNSQMNFKSRMVN